MANDPTGILIRLLTLPKGREESAKKGLKVGKGGENDVNWPLWLPLCPGSPQKFIRGN